MMRNYLVEAAWTSFRRGEKRRASARCGVLRISPVSHLCSCVARSFAGRRGRLSRGAAAIRLDPKLAVSYVVTRTPSWRMSRRDLGPARHQDIVKEWVLGAF